MFAEALEAILKDHCTPAVVRSIEEGASGLDLWESVESAGFVDLLYGYGGVSCDKDKLNKLRIKSPT